MQSWDWWGMKGKKANVNDGCLHRVLSYLLVSKHWT